MSEDSASVHDEIVADLEVRVTAWEKLLVEAKAKCEAAGQTPPDLDTWSAFVERMRARLDKLKHEGPS